MSASTNNENGVSDMFVQAAKLFESALQAGIKTQEESTKSMANMIGGMGSPKQWQERAQTVMEQTMAAAQTNMDEAIRVMNENTKTGLDLLQKAFDARQGQWASDPQSRTKEVWEAAVGSMRSNTEAMVQANNRVLESWREMAKVMRGEEAAKEN